ASQEVKAKRIDRVTKAILLAGTRQKEVEVTAVKQNRIYYRDVVSEVNDWHHIREFVTTRRLPPFRFSY
ncbi:hypothetical protein ONO57_26055, partial [Salmonella enterica subsp. enterica serovar Anatum]|nr:hypothetical protein [Salmonella enterica subsp. enterica serovar Anatum]